MSIIIKKYLGQCLQTKSVFPKHSSGVLRSIFRDLRILNENFHMLCSQWESKLNIFRII